MANHPSLTAKLKARPYSRAFLLLGSSSPQLERRVAVSPCRRRQSVRLMPPFTSLSASEDHPHQPVEQCLEGEEGEEQGQEGHHSREHQLQEHVPTEWHGPDLLDDGIGSTQIGEGLDIRGAEQGFPVSVRRAQPAVLEAAAVLGGEGAVFPQPQTLGRQNMGGKDRQRRQHQQQAEAGEQNDLRFVGGEYGGVIEDPVGDKAGQLGPQRGQQRRVGVGRAPEKAEAAVAIGMGRHEGEGDPGDLPEEAGPDQEPVEPAQEQKLDDGVAHPEEPETGQGQGRATPFHGGVPGRGLQDEGVGPDEVPHREDQQDKPDLCGDRISPDHGAANGVMKAWQGERRDQPPFDELADDPPDALVDDEFGEHQQGDADEKADMGLYVQQKGHRHPLQQAAVPPAQQQQGQPADPAQDEDPSPDVRLYVTKMRPAPQLIEGAPQDQGEVAGIGQGRAEGIGRGDRPVMRHDGTTLLCDKCAIRPPPAPLATRVEGEAAACRDSGLVS